MHAKTAKARRAEKDRQHRIITYNLFHDPFLKTSGAVSDKRHPGAGDLRGLTATAFPAIAANSPGLPSRIPSSAAAPLKLAPMEEEGFAFDCKEKPSAAVPARRGLTACFKQRLDNSWKTQTYVSGTRSDGNVSWGGGLSLGYDY
ncbi:MAG TPA: hypothetical protein VJ698_12125 [Noviherbaspirillum sp.]|uniref:hypothetical protein n=1 Tax=Noviherbaspirillum sp. TaxID=1926288 RepID=UPI002B48A30A|nr:hypothetical protein [Noviherbaspirillum sp.]HJV86211.1 hypothetical protein [Noviherbaspirillum sp.]